MANKVVTNLGSELMKFTFTDGDGDVFAYFRMNPADVKLYNRLRNVDKKLEEIGKLFEGHEETEEVATAFNDAVEELFCYVLGYDVKETLFGFMSATAVMSDGEHFFMKVLDVMTEAVGKEVEKRGKNMAKKIGKYTNKYAK